MLSNAFIPPDSILGCDEDGCMAPFSSGDWAWGLVQVLSLTTVYAYLLYTATNMLSDGSELLLLVPSMAGIVGSVVLPLVAAVPDGAILGGKSGHSLHRWPSQSVVCRRLHSRRPRAKGWRLRSGGIMLALAPSRRDHSLLGPRPRRADAATGGRRCSRRLDGHAAHRAARRPTLTLALTTGPDPGPGPGPGPSPGPSPSH